MVCWSSKFPQVCIFPHVQFGGYIGSPKNYLIFFPILAHSVEVEQIGIEQNYNHHYIFTPTPQFNFFICSKGESQVQMGARHCHLKFLSSGQGIKS